MIRRTLCLLVLAACGGASTPPPVAIPEQPSEHVLAAPKALGGTATRTLEDLVRPTGADGPRDAKSILGPIGEIVGGPQPTMLFVNTTEMRAHPNAGALGKALTTALVGWNDFLPTDLIDPVEHTDWVVMTGGIHLGATARNTILARYNVSESRADVVWKELERRLSGKPLGAMSGAKVLMARVDGADRAYIRGKAGTLAIVPLASAKAVAEIAMRVDPPASLRPGELVRFAARDARAMRVAIAADDAGPIVLWLESAGDGAVLHAEAEHGDPSGAERSVDLARSRLSSYAKNPFLTRFTDPLVKRAEIRADGKTLRYRAELDGTLLRFLDGAL